MFDTRLKDGESEYAYLWRLGSAKENGLITLSWEEIADLINANFREDTPYKDCAYRKAYQYAQKFCEANVLREYDGDSTALLSLKHDIEKERVKLRDERSAARTAVRNEARRDYDIELLFDSIKRLGEKRYESCNTYPMSFSDKELIVLLSDLHIGATYNSVSGSYNSDIARKRMDEYANFVISLAKKEDVSKVFIVGLGDFISGGIHKSVAVTNRENVIDQITLACEYVSDFVYNISCEVPYVEFHCVPGNHSRLEKKEDALTDERLDSLIPWFVKNVLSHQENLYVNIAQKDATYCSFQIGGKTYVGVHGDYDGISAPVVKNLCMWLREIPYCILMGHKHFNAITESAGVKVVQSGSLCGTGDNFTREKRIRGNAQQMVLVCENGVIQEYHPIEWYSI